MKHLLLRTCLFLLFFLFIISFTYIPKHLNNGVGLAVLHHRGITPGDWNELYYFIKREAVIHFIPFEVLIGISCRETGFYTSELAVKANNIFGIKAIRGEWKGEVYTKMHVEIDAITGKKTKTECKFRKYATKEDCVRDFFKFIGHERYAAAWNCGENDIECWISTLQKSGYATDSSYSDAILTLLHRDYNKLYGKTEIAPAYKIENTTP